jgi:hypothetical protein
LSSIWRIFEKREERWLIKIGPRSDRAKEACCYTHDQESKSHKVIVDGHPSIETPQFGAETRPEFEADLSEDSEFGTQAWGFGETVGNERARRDNDILRAENISARTEDKRSGEYTTGCPLRDTQVEIPRSDPKRDRGANVHARNPWKFSISHPSSFPPSSVVFVVPCKRSVSTILFQRLPIADKRPAQSFMNPMPFDHPCDDFEVSQGKPAQLDNL